MHDRIMAIRTKIQKMDKYLFDVTCSPKLYKMPNNVHDLEVLTDELVELVMVIYTRSR